MENCLSDSNKEIREIGLKAIDKAANLEYLQYQGRGEKARYNFEWKNESLILKNSVSSSIFTNEYLYSYYNYKLNNFRSSDANMYLDGLNNAIPLMNKKDIDDFSIEEILEIRKMREWKKAMGRLGEICSTAKYDYGTKEFREEIRQEITEDFICSFDKSRQTKQDLLTSCIKNLFWTAISFIPMGPLIPASVVSTASAVGSMGDTVVSYLFNERKQKALPVFISNIRNMK